MHNLDGFFVAKLKVSKPEKGALGKRAGVQENKAKGGTDEKADEQDDVHFDEEEDKVYLEGLFISISSYYTFILTVYFFHRERS